jgi:hypothetical protein
MPNEGPLSNAEVKDLLDVWYQKLDVHAPIEEVYPLLADAELEMRFPEATVRGHQGFAGWYDTVTRRFFDEVHTLTEWAADPAGEQTKVTLVVNWQAKIWDPPAAKSQWLGFDAYQTWYVKRSPESGKAVITTYIVDELRPMPGSASL